MSFHNVHDCTSCTSILNLPDLFRAGALQKSNDWANRIAPDYGVVKQNNTLILDVLMQCSELLTHAQLSQSCARLDERPSDVAVFTQHFNVRQARL